MNIKLIINIVQIVISILLIAAVLMQAKGTGLGSAFGGEGTVFRTKRGIEKSLHTVSIILSTLFLALSLVNIFL